MTTQTRLPERNGRDGIPVYETSEELASESTLYKVLERLVRGATVRGAVYVTDKMVVPQIAAADALDAGDAMGGIFRFENVPEYGIIRAARLWDPDDDTLSPTLHLFSQVFAATANDAALNISAADSLEAVDSIAFSTSVDLGGGKVHNETGLDIWYWAPDKTLYCQMTTAATPNIAAGVMPQVRLFIEPRVRA